MSIDGQTFIKRFEQHFPLYLAEKGDPVGLHIGTLHKPIKKIMITLDVRPEVVQEAIEKDIDLLIAKHPPIFRPITRLKTDNPQIKMYEDLLKNEIAVYAAHTNMDIAENGLNDWFCEELNIGDTTFLTKTHEINGQDFGIGRVGLLKESMTLDAFTAVVKKVFDLDGLRVITNNIHLPISRVAICGGSGEKFYPDAIKHKADVYITGDVYYHTAHDMLSNGLNVIDAGHHIEKLCQKRILDLCIQWKKTYNWEVEFLSSETNTNPFQYF